jgi:TIR domain/SIR2-like domain
MGNPARPGCVKANATVPQPTALLERRFGGLVAKIEEGDCVLVLGPRIAAPRAVAGGDVPIDEHLAARLREDLGDTGTEPMDLRHAIARYQRERSASACRSLMQELAAEFDGQTTDLHLDLASLPFRLVLSATPDRMMAQALRTKGKTGVREACYDYCRGADASLRLPTIDEPIVYSLFGRHDRPESMVLDDKNLLDYLVKITRESPALPDEVRATLRAPSTVFLFVGFGFTNWWLRLLLKVLDVTGVENRGLSLALEDESTLKAAAASEHTGFFEPLGIYIRARDWNALAKELASRIRPAPLGSSTGPPVRDAATGPAAPGVTGRGGVPANARPLVFLSYASEDVDRVSTLRDVLQRRGVTVWHDKQNLRAGQNWDDQIVRIIRAADFFVFVQTDKMDERDRQRLNGVYNRELKRAFERLQDLPYGATYLIHVTMSECRPRPERELERVHRIAADTEAGCEQLAQAILDAYQEAAAAVR